MDNDNEIIREERGIYLVMAMVSIPVIAGVLIAGDRLDTGFTISSAMLALAILGIITLRHHRAEPLARATVRRKA